MSRTAAFPRLPRLFRVLADIVCSIVAHVRHGIVYLRDLTFRDGVAADYGGAVSGSSSAQDDERIFILDSDFRLNSNPYLDGAIGEDLVTPSCPAAGDPSAEGLPFLSRAIDLDPGESMTMDLWAGSNGACADGSCSNV